jgi:hypothetical protein
LSSGLARYLPTRAPRPHLMSAKANGRRRAPWAAEFKAPFGLLSRLLLFRAARSTWYGRGRSGRGAAFSSCADSAAACVVPAEHWPANLVRYNTVLFTNSGILIAFVLSRIGEPLRRTLIDSTGLATLSRSTSTVHFKISASLPYSHVQLHVRASRMRPGMCSGGSK